MAKISKLDPMKNRILKNIIRITAVAILVQTLYFKFTGAPESIYIFTQLGIEPFGRIGSGIVELLASVFLLIPRTIYVGAFLGFATMVGAVISHIFVLGIEVQNDGGLLFILALTVLLCCTILLYFERSKFEKFIKIK